MSEYASNALRKRFRELNVAPQFDGYSGVEIVVDEETTYFAGTTTGRVLTIENPWGTQAQADNILLRIRGFQYQPYSASGAFLSPAAEIGDGVNLNGVYSGVYKLDRSYSRLMDADISAPADEEIDHEFAYTPKEERKIQRRFAAVEAEFVIQSNLIAAKVSQTGGNNSSFGWTLTATDHSWYAGNTRVMRVNSSGLEVTGKITATSGKIGNFNIGERSIWNNIEDFENSGNLSSGVYVGTNGIRLGRNFTVNSSGNVTATSMSLKGTLQLYDKDGNTYVSLDAKTLANRATSAYNSTSSGGYCYTGATYGNNYNNAINAWSSGEGLRTNYLVVGQTTSTGHIGATSADIGSLTVHGRTATWIYNSSLGIFYLGA